jgi:hypothetical protein
LSHSLFIFLPNVIALSISIARESFWAAGLDVPRSFVYRYQNFCLQLTIVFRSSLLTHATIAQHLIKFFSINVHADMLQSIDTGRFRGLIAQAFVRGSSVSSLSTLKES